MLKKLFLLMLNFFDRRQVAHFARRLMNKSLGENNGDFKSNGELFLLRQVLNYRQKSKKIIIFDVGANVGEWTTSLLKIAVEQKIINNMNIYSFEPSKYTFSILKSNLEKNYYGGGIHTINSGIGSAQGLTKFYINKDGVGTNSLYKRRLEGLGIFYDKSETIQVTTIDIFCREAGVEYIDFLKIDVEGHELAVIRGAADMLKKQAIDYIQFEYGGCWIDSRTLFMDMYDFLTGYEYAIGKIMPSGIEFYDKYDERLETFQMANFLVCKPALSRNFVKIKPWMV